MAQNSPVTLRCSCVRIQLKERRCVPYVMVEKRTAIKCVEEIEPDRDIVFGSFAKPNAMVCATNADS